MQTTFQVQDSTCSEGVEHEKQVLLLHFLSAALQIMPAQLCCDTATTISRLIDSSVDENVKTTAYLTLEVLYASRRLNEFGDHIETLLRHLLENPELPDLEEMREAGSQANKRIVAYIQATSQIVLNHASNETNKSEFMQRQILRYITLSCSVFCEYLAGDNSRLQRAAFSAMRLIMSHGLKPWLMKDLGGAKKGKDDMLELLKFDALSLSEEVKNVRDSAGGGFSQMTP